ncbi:MAG: adenylate/guanylate cyclase domain-containing protein [Pseudomonadota bacterium]
MTSMTLDALPAGRTAAQQRDTETFAETALQNAKREGLWLAVRARWIALAIVAIMLPFLNPTWEVTYYLALTSLFALIGWAQLKVGRAGVSRPELFLMFCDLALITFIAVVQNPWSMSGWPAATQYRFDTFIYFFIFLAGATLAYSWRTLIAMGVWASGLWILGAVYVYFRPHKMTNITDAIRAATLHDQRLFTLLDPNNINVPARVQEIVVFLIAACTLAIAVRRSNMLLLKHASLERERTNLARYFSPNVVEELSKNDEPLKQVRTQDIAVLFVDIVGFTSFADGKAPEDIIGTLREFHGRMETEVFRHGGTLDKYLGDGLMATFGTPFSGATDAINALACAQAMIAAIDTFNGERTAAGEVPIRASFGLHYGPVVLGDIGRNRLEFAVIGSTVNAAARLEALTRHLGCVLVASDALVQRAKSEKAAGVDAIPLVQQPAQTLRGLEQPIGVWTLSQKS